MTKFNGFFPEFLDKGSDDRPAVTMLQTWLRLLGHTAVNVDGEYGEFTATAVAELQRKMGLPADGNFGPDTREKFLEWHNVDVNAIPESLMKNSEVIPVNS